MCAVINNVSNDQKKKKCFEVTFENCVVSTGIAEMMSILSNSSVFFSEHHRVRVSHFFRILFCTNKLTNKERCKTFIWVTKSICV